MARKPTRTWAFVASLGIPLAIVGLSAMAISYATLIDVARVNGLPLPELFPVLVDVGTVSSMIAAAQFRLRGLSGRWLAYLTFLALSGVSILANASHAERAADLTVTSGWVAAILAAIPPATLLAITHLVMLLIPDEKERARLQSQQDRTVEPQETRRTATIKAGTPQRPETRQAPAPAPARVEEPQLESATGQAEPAPLRLVNSQEPAAGDEEVRQLVLGYLEREGKRPTGKIVGDWLSKTPKTGQRFLKRMEDEGAFELEAAAEPVLAASL